MIEAEQLAYQYMIKEHHLSKDIPLHIIKNDEVFSLEFNAYIAGYEARKFNIGWIDTAHIEIKLHDAVENIKKQIDSTIQEVLKSI